MPPFRSSLLTGVASGLLLGATVVWAQTTTPPPPSPPVPHEPVPIEITLPKTARAVFQPLDTGSPYVWCGVVVSDYELLFQCVATPPPPGAVQPAPAPAPTPPPAPTR
jgi:hypothetical protein